MATLWDTRDLSRARQQNTASVLPTARPEEPLESVLGRPRPELCWDSAASWANSLSHSPLQPRAFCLVFSKHQGIQQPQWPLFQLNLPESRCTDPPGSSRTLTGAGPLCEACTAGHCWYLCCVWGECWNGLAAPVKAIPLLPGTVYLNYISFIIFFYFLIWLENGNCITSVNFSSFLSLSSLLHLAAAFFHKSTGVPVHQAQVGRNLTGKTLSKSGVLLSCSNKHFPFTFLSFLQV